jgi:hypothetical protein
MLVVNGVKFSYNDLWIKTLQKDTIGYRITLIDKMILNKYYSKLYRMLYLIKKHNWFE